MSKSKQILVICDNCGKLFSKRIANYNQAMREGRNIYCSRKCQGEAYSERFKGTCTRKSEKPTTKITINCEWCDKPIQKFPSQMKKDKHHYCSKVCALKGRHKFDFEKLYGIKYESIVDNAEEYHKLVKYLRTCKRMWRWRNEVLERDNCECQECGDTEKLEVHHIYELSRYLHNNNIDSAKKAHEDDGLWDISNGITLCIYCHAEKHENYKHIILRRA